MKGPLDGKVAIVTGGSRGIGAEVGGRLAEDGAAVVVSGRDGERLQRTVHEWEAQGRAVLGVVADAANREDCERLVSSAKQHFGRIDVLVNNAGMTHDQLLVRMTDEDWDRVIEVNLRSAFLMTRAVSKALVRQKSGGRVINITSTAGAMGNAGQVNYSAAKAGLVGLTKSLAREVATRDITVNGVAPGFIETEMTASLAEPARQAAVAAVPMQRMGTAEEVAAAIAFLVSPGASYITGHVLHVDGGLGA